MTTLQLGVAGEGSPPPPPPRRAVPSSPPTRHPAVTSLSPPERRTSLHAAPFRVRLAALAVVALAGPAAVPARATGNVPRHTTVKRDLVDPSSGRTWPGTGVMYCNLTRGHVSVHASRSSGPPWSATWNRAARPTGSSPR